MDSLHKKPAIENDRLFPPGLIGYSHSRSAKVEAGDGDACGNEFVAMGHLQRCINDFLNGTHGHVP